MLSAFMAIFGAVGGGALRLIPVLINAWLDHDARVRELALARIELEKTRCEAEAATGRSRADDGQHDDALREVRDTANAALSQAHAALTALESMPVSHAAPDAGSRVQWANALNLAVRPAVTLWLLLLYTVYKATLIAVALLQHTPFADMAKVIWNDDDITIFSGAIAFWFIDQALTETQGKKKPRR